MTREQFLNARFNNRLSMGLGMIVLGYLAAVLLSSVWAESGAFWGMVVISGMF